MFLDFYRLHEQPFGVTPDRRYLYFSPAHREALASLFCGIETGRGFLALIAQPGMGKTSLLFQLLERLRSSAQSAFLFQTQCDSSQLLRYLMHDLGLDGHDYDVVRMHARLNEFLLGEAQAGRRVVLVIDEAQNLSDSVLETVRLLSDFEAPDRKLLQIVLAGQPELAHRLSRPGLSQLRQRIAILKGLDPLPPAEVVRFINHRLRVAGYEGPELFTPAALTLISEGSQGIPRNINNICFNALSLGGAMGCRKIGREVVSEAIADLSLDSFVRQPPDVSSISSTVPAMSQPSYSPTAAAMKEAPTATVAKLETEPPGPTLSPSCPPSGPDSASQVLPPLDSTVPLAKGEPAPTSASLPTDDSVAGVPQRAQDKAATGAPLAATTKVNVPQPTSSERRSEDSLNPAPPLGIDDFDLEEIPGFEATPVAIAVEATPVREAAADSPPLLQVPDKRPRATARFVNNQSVEPSATSPVPCEPASKARPAQPPAAKHQPFRIPPATDIRPQVTPTATPGAPSAARGQNSSPAAPAPPAPSSAGSTLQNTLARSPVDLRAVRSPGLALSITQVASQSPGQWKRWGRIVGVAAGALLCSSTAMWWAVHSMGTSSAPAAEVLTAPDPKTLPIMPTASQVPESAALAQLSATVLETSTSTTDAAARAGSESRLPLRAKAGVARTPATAARPAGMARTAPPRPRATDAKAAAKVLQATRLSPAEQGKLKDRLVVAGFLMDRHEYDGALDAFEAALKIDPSNPEALASIEPARRARDVEKANAQ